MRREDKHPDARRLRREGLSRDEPLVGVARRHPDVDDRSVGSVTGDDAQQVLGGAHLGDDVAPRRGEQARDAFAHEDRVVGDDETHRLRQTASTAPIVSGERLPFEMNPATDAPARRDP